MSKIEFNYDSDTNQPRDYLKSDTKDGYFCLSIKDEYLVCNQCHFIKEKSFRFFPRDNSKSDGMRKTCKACVRFNKLLRSFKTEDLTKTIKKLEYLIAHQSQDLKFDYETYLRYLKDGDIHPSTYYKYRPRIDNMYFTASFKHAMLSNKASRDKLKEVSTP